MGRPGDFFDQDHEEEEDTPSPRPPERAARGMVYDWDAVVEEQPADPRRAAETRRRRIAERQLEVEQRRAAELERERAARRRRTRSDPPVVPIPPVRISSRPAIKSGGAVTTTPVPTARGRSSGPQPGEGAEAPAPDRPAARRAPAPPPPPPVAPRRPRPERADPVTPAPAPAARREPPAAATPPAASTTPAPGAPPAARAPTAVGAIAPARPTAPQSTSQATAILAVGTFASRLTGFVRVLAVLYVLGDGNLSDAYNYANGIPNIVYDLLIGGVLSATLIPVFVDLFRSGDEDEQNRGISAVLTAVAAALVVFSGVLWLCAPWVIRFYLLLYPKSVGAAERGLATTLLRYFAPQVFFLGAIVVSTALLNARRRFTAAAVSPVVNNFIAIAAVLVTKVIADHALKQPSATASEAVARLHAFSHDERAVVVLGLGTTIGYVVQFFVQLPAMHRAGMRIRLVWDLHHPAVRRVASLSSWLVGVVLANQASLALIMVLAGKKYGGLTAYQSAYQFFQLPYALIAVSVASAVMPNLAERWSAGDLRGFERQLVVGLRVTLAVLVPVSLAYAAIAQPSITLLVHHGQVSHSSAHMIASTLALFVFGLPGFAAFFLLMRGYQAMQRPKAMFWIYVLENGLTVVAALILDPRFGVPGLAIAWAGPYTIAAIVAAVDLRRRIGRLGGRVSLRALLRIIGAGALAGAVVAAVGLPFPASNNDLLLIGRLILQVGAGTAVYLVAAWWLNIKELRPIGRMARRMLGSG